MSVFTTNRRQFLQGAGSITLALPVMTSLLPRRAFAGEYPYAVSPRYVHFAHYHGGLWGENMWPDDGILTERSTVLPGHEIRSGLLSAATMGATRMLSPVLSADASMLTERIVAQLNLLRGLDFPMYLGHHSGAFLGNYGRNDQEYSEGGLSLPYRPTIDQVMAWSDGVYPDLDGILARSMNIGSGHSEANISWGWSSPSLGSGAVEAIPRAVSSQALFAQIFRSDMESEDEELVVDKVIESYNSLRNGAFGPARRLSESDRLRLDAHMEHLFELERRLGASVRCEALETPIGNADSSHAGGSSYSLDIDGIVEYYDLYTDVIAAAFMCDSSRVATIDVHQTFSLIYTRDDWHNEVAHVSHHDSGQDQLVDAAQMFFEQVYLAFLHKLDVEEANGMTYLDNALVCWSQEAGCNTHENIGIPVVTAGSAAGVMTTGHYHDYRNRSLSNAYTEAELAYVTDPDALARHAHTEAHPGLLYNQYLATALQAMGSMPDEWEESGTSGYGILEVDDTTLWPESVQGIASDFLPGLAAD